MVDIKKGALVIEYTGEVSPPFTPRAGYSTDIYFFPSQQVIPIDESYRRVIKEYADSTSYYFLQYDAYDVIDAVCTFCFPILISQILTSWQGG